VWLISTENRPAFRPVFFFWFFAFAVLTSLADTPDDAVTAHRELLVAKALELRLYEDPYWRLLGHYRPRWISGYKSMIDDPAFFCAPDGKYNPKAEMMATIAAFFEPPPEDPEARHPMCRFPARFAWLDEHLNFNREIMPVSKCEPYDQVYAYLKPAKLTLVFPAAYMNSPASMFGHTLLVFDAVDQNRLLAKGVGYAAAVTTGFGPLFALEGIFGMYPGLYNIEDYSEKVQTYSDIHRRDIWEYELELTQEEVDRTFRHTWELQNIWSWYYFFDENCAYKLYQLIDVARPGMNLSDDPSWFVMPIGTVRLINDKDLVRAYSFRPSKATRLLAMSEQLPENLRQRALAVARGNTEPQSIATDDTLPIAVRRLSLDLSADYTQYLYTDLALTQDEYARRYIGILRERSKLGSREEREFVITPPAPPEQGHGPGLIAPGVGIENGDAFLSLRGRVAYHGLLDNDTGFNRGAQIMFLNSEGRWNAETEDFELRFADIVHVESIAPRTDLFAPVSWRVRLGFTQMDMMDQQNGLIFSAQTGGGAAWEIGQRQLFWAMLESEIHLGDRYEHYAAIGPGASINWMYTATPGWKWLLQARTAWMYEGDEDWWRAEGLVGTDIRLTRGQSLRLNYQYTLNDDHEIHEAGLSWNFYF
jgi:hypothetical protein